MDRIDVGGMAEVFRGRMGGVEGFERPVALKRILPNIAADPDFVEMFVDEAKLAVQFQHANIAQIYELGKVDETYFIAMEYVSGVSLRTMWDRARGRNRLLPIAMSCHVMQKVCEGLDAAHRKKDEHSGDDLGLVHRDVSPQNVLVSFEGEVKVIDFGIAKSSNKVSKTQAGVLKGKFGYMSPEQVRGIELDNRSDIFACGVVLYELLVGDRLFLGESDFSTLEKIRNVEMVPPTQLNKNLSPHLERIVMKALCRSREDRYRWASEMAEDLQRYLFATNQPFARTDLQRYMQQHFRVEQDEEKERLRKLRELEVESPEPVGPPPELATEVGVGALASPAGMSGMHAAQPVSEFGYEPSEATGPIFPPIPPVPPPASPRFPLWAAVSLTVAVTLLLVGLVALAVLGPKLLRSPGGISVRYTPADASFYLDERLVANASPVALEGLEPGPHVVALRAEGFADVVRPVNVVSNELTGLVLAMKPSGGSARLHVETVPAGLSVEFDGRARSGQTPVTLDRLAAGSHRLVLKHPDGGLAHRADVTLPAEGLKEISIDLSKLPPVLEVGSDPEGAQLRVNGLLLGKTPMTLDTLDPGKVRLSFKREGCAPQKLERQLQRGRIEQVQVALDCTSP